MTSSTFLPLGCAPGRSDESREAEQTTICNGDTQAGRIAVVQTLLSSLMQAMKHPRLPGTEKFKFSEQDEDSQPPSFVRGGQYRSSCPPSAFSRPEPKRRPVIPITSKTSRVLYNTGQELTSVDGKPFSVNTPCPVIYRNDVPIRTNAAPRNNNDRISWPLYGSLRIRGRFRPTSDDYSPVQSSSSTDSIQEVSADEHWLSGFAEDNNVWLPRK